MSLSAGTRLGPYEVLSTLGAGGMGEVYQAKDTRLGREVAIKIIPEALAGPQSLERFEREAHAVAQLSHPNILAIFDIGRDGETAYAVMELLEGDTLRQRLAQGALPTRKAVDLAAQIAEGLAAAHEKGIVHRDLKPENVFVTTDGRVKLLDFGLAKEATPASRDESAIGTEANATDPGTVLGTARYMSPEQVRGQAVDARSDIFSFGVVLYEMLTGKQAFRRETTAESMTAILKEELPEIAVSGSAPSPALQRIVQHCLEKKPGERFQSARDISFALQSFSGSEVTGGPKVAATRTSSRLWLATVVAIAVAAIGLAAFAAYRYGEKAGLGSIAQLRFHPRSFRPQMIFQAAFMPDGETIVYSAALEGNVPELFVIRPEYPEAQPLGLPRTHLLSVSSRGELAILTNARYLGHRLFTGTLARVALGGAAPREILEDARQAAWSPDGSSLAVIRTAKGKDRLEYPIGKVLYETPGYLSDLRVSPRGDAIALFEHPKRFDDRGSVILVDLAGRRTLLSAGYETEEGLVWSGEEVLFSAAVDGSHLTVFGVDRSGRRRVAHSGAGGLTIHDVSRGGRWLATRDEFFSGISALAPGATFERDLSWLDDSHGAVLSRDARLLVFDDESSFAGHNYWVCLRKTEGGPVMRLGEGSPLDLSADGKWVLASISTPPQLVIYPTGPGEARHLPRGTLETYAVRGKWFPDGKHILVTGNEAGKASRCYVQDLSGGPPRPITPEGTEDGFVSQDGRRILVSKPSEGWFLQDVEGGDLRPVPELSVDDQVIRWGPDGRSVYVYRPTRVPFRFERVDLGTGRRELIREVAPPDRTGVLRSWSASMTEDETAYAYDYQRKSSHLFVVEGAR